MFTRALKSNVIICIAVLLFIGMGLIDFVVVHLFQQRAIQSEIDKAELFVSAVQNDLAHPGNSFPFSLSADLSGRLQSLFSDTGLSCVLIRVLHDRSILSFGEGCGDHLQLQEHVARIVASDRRRLAFSGTVWGVFWWQRKELVLFAPLQAAGRFVGGIAEGLYRDLRSAHKFVLIYLCINIVLLTFVGFHRLFKVFLEPIDRLAKRAENYQDTDGAFFPVRKQDNELQVLSSALNSMTRRITEDKEKLRAGVSSLEKANIELKKAQEEIIRAEKLASVGRLSSGIAHEIGNPIGIISGYLELLKREDIHETERRDYMSRTEKELQRMDTVIRQLLDLSRQSAVDSDIISIHEVIHDIANVLQVQPLMSKIDLSLSLSASADRVKADPNQLRQVFLNLAINAADAIAATGDGRTGRLQITTADGNPHPEGRNESPPMIDICFNDNGPGISADILDNIFDPFFTTKSPGKGTGLGLYVCFMIIDSLGGFIQAHRQKGWKTTMMISLPLAE